MLTRLAESVGAVDLLDELNGDFGALRSDGGATGSKLSVARKACSITVIWGASVGNFCGGLK